MVRAGLVLATLACLVTPAVAHGDQEHDHDHAHHGHIHAFEIGVAPGLVYLPGESEFVFGLHLHLVWTLADTAWGVGIGAERLFDEHAHNTISGVVQYRIVDPWSVALSVGLTFEDEEPADLDPSVHIETTYDVLTFDRVHVGPSLEFAADPNDVHFTLGVHVGLGI